MADGFSVILKSLREMFPKTVFCVDETEDCVILRSDITDSDEATLFVELYESITQTNFRLYNQKTKTNGLEFKKEWVCQRCIPSAESEEKCQAKISIKVKRNDEFLYYSPPLPALIKIIPHHNHNNFVKEVSSSKLLRIPSEVREIYYGYFKKGITGVKAKRLYEENLLKWHLTALDGTKMNPRVSAIYTLYKRWKKSQNVQATKVSSDSGAECLARERTPQHDKKTASSSYENSGKRKPSVVCNTRQRTSQQCNEGTTNSHEMLEYQNLPKVEYPTSQEDRKRASEISENDVPVIKIEDDSDEIVVIKIEDETDEDDDSDLPKIVSCCSVTAKKEEKGRAQSKRNDVPHNLSNTMTVIESETTPINGNMMPANTSNNIPHTNTTSNMPLNTGSIVMPKSTANMMPINMENNVLPMPNIPILTNSSVGINNQPMPFITNQIIGTSPTNPSLPLQRVVPISTPHIILYNPSSNTFTVVQLNPSTSPIVNSSNLYSTYFPDRIQLPTRVGVHKL